MWKRCPKNHVFNIPDNAWEAAATSSAFSLMCPICHEKYTLSEFENFMGGRATLSVSNLTEIKIGNFTVASVQGAFVERLKKLYPKGSLQTQSGYDDWANGMFVKVCQLLTTSEVTSNFPTPRIWQILESGRMKNMWHFNPQTNASNYAAERNSGEQQFFSTINTVLDAGADQASAFDRPVYLVLNANNLLQGGAAAYGQSYLVWRDEVKMRCTFLATDSLQLIKAEKRQISMQAQPGLGVNDLVNIGQLPQLLFKVTDRKLKFLCSLAGGPPHDYVDEFIEAHGWGELRLDYDVKAIVISKTDLNSLLTAREDDNLDLFPPELKGLSQDQRRTKVDSLKERLFQFCSEFKIELQLLDLDINTRTATTPRPKAM